MDNFAPGIFPFKDTAVATTFVSLIAQFGDGYTQRADSGINNTKDTWTLTWTVLTEAQSNYIYAFMVAHRVAAFTYSDLDSGLFKYRCTAISKTFDVLFFKVDATIEQVYDMG